MSDRERRDPDYRGGRAEQGISVLDIIAIIARRKALIILMTAAIAVIVVAFLLTTVILPPTSRWNRLPTKYKPTVKILLQDTTPASALSSMLNQGGLGSLSDLLGAGGGARGSNADLAKALLAGNAICDGVAEEFGFAEKYHFTKFPKTSARQRIKSALKVIYDGKSGILEIGYEDIDPVFATNVVNGIGNRLQQEFKRLTLDKVSSKRQYLEESIAQATRDAGDKSAQLLAFQNKYGIYDLPAQAQANISAVASLQSQLTSKQMELQLQRKYLPESDSRIVRLKDEISQAQRLISEMKTGGTDAVAPSVPLSTMAGLSVQYLNIQRDLQIQQAVLTALKQQYEITKIEEMDSSRVFQVVETAEVPEVRWSPNRGKMAIIDTIVGFILSVLAAFVVEYFARAKINPASAEKLLQIRSALGLRKRLPRK